MAFITFYNEHNWQNPFPVSYSATDLFPKTEVWVNIGIPTPLKNMKVSWDYSSQYMESHKIHVPNHQPVVVLTPIILMATVIRLPHVLPLSCCFWPGLLENHPEMFISSHYPLVKIQKTMENHNLSWVNHGKSTMSMTMAVKLPEGRDLGWICGKSTN